MLFSVKHSFKYQPLLSILIIVTNRKICHMVQQLSLEAQYQSVNNMDAAAKMLKILEIEFSIHSSHRRYISSNLPFVYH